MDKAARPSHWWSRIDPTERAIIAFFATVIALIVILLIAAITYDCHCTCVTIGYTATTGDAVQSCTPHTPTPYR